MNKIGKQYIKEVKSLFPIMGKKEKDYIKKLINNVEEYCEEEVVVSKQDLYDNYGTPNSVVIDYYSSVDTDYIVKKMRFSKYIKVAIVSVLALLTISSATFCVTLLQKNAQLEEKQQILIENFEIAHREEVVSVDEEIEIIERHEVE